MTGGAGTAVIEILSTGTPALGDRSYPVTDGQVALVVDRQWTGGHARGAVHIPLQDLPPASARCPRWSAT